MNFIEVSGYIRIRAINVILPGFKGYGEKEVFLIIIILAPKTGVLIILILTPKTMFNHLIMLCYKWRYLKQREIRLNG